MRAGFVTCVQLGLNVMQEIYSLNGRLDLAITLPDSAAANKSGRVYLDEFCQRHDLPLLKAGSINDQQVVDAVRAAELDWLFIIGWSQIARQEILAAPRQGCVGMHPTLLPEGRGRASIPWAIIKGLPTTGVTMFVLDDGVDTGPILAQESIPLTDTTTATELYGEVIQAHRSLIREAWPQLMRGDIRPRPQDRSAGSVWPSRSPEDGRLATSMKLDDALRIVRATTKPYPGAFWESDIQRIRVWSAHKVGEDESLDGRPAIKCQDGVLVADEWEMEQA